MAQVGERYFFVSRSSQKGHDRLRTLLGKFWTWHAGLVIADKIDTATTAGGQVRKEQKQRIVNYLSKRRSSERKVVAAAKPSYRLFALARYRNFTRTRLEEPKNAYVLPKGTLIHRSWARSWWNKTRDDGSRLEIGLVFYGNDIFRKPTRNTSRFKSRLWSALLGPGVAQSHEDRMDRIVKTIVQNTMRGILSAGNVWMEDFSFGFERPIHRSITDKMNSGGGFVRVASVKNHSQYEYFLENYEVLAFNQAVDERELPNTYLVNMIQDVEERLNSKQSRAISLDERAYNAVSMWKKIDKKAISFRVVRNDEDAIKQPRKTGKKQRKRRGGTNSDSAYMNYLELWSKAHKATRSGIIRDIRQKNTNILFSADSYDYFQQISSKSKNIPMSAKLEFSAPVVRQEHSLTELLRRANFMTVFMQKAIESNIDPDMIAWRPRQLWGSTVKQEWLSSEQAAGKEATTGMTRQGELLSEAEYETVETFTGDAVTGSIVESRGAMTKAAVYDRETLDRDWGTIDYYPQTFTVDEEDRVRMTSGKSPVRAVTPGFDILRFLDSITTQNISDVLDETVQHQNIVIHTGKEINPYVSPVSVVKLNALILAGQARKLIEENTRTWQQVIAGQESPHEILFFEVEKFRISSTGLAEVVQRFYIPNFVGRDSIEFVDAQIKYDRVYQYNIHAWTAVYGNRYRYRNWKEFGNYSLDTGELVREYLRSKDRSPSKLTRGPRRDGFYYRVENRPSLRLLRLPYYKCEPMRVRDFPPVAPHVDIVPYRGVADRLILNFTPGVDDHQDNPISLGATDLPKIRKYYESQFNKQNAASILDKLQETGVADTPIRYKSDDMPRYYEVYRTTVPPHSWGDFEGTLIRVLDVDKGETSMLDNIYANEDYYYTFRTLDIHGNISNPSDVLRVKMIDDQGIFPIIEPYDFDSKTRTNELFKKSFRRFVQITPVFEQLVYKDERQSEKKTSIANRRKIVLGTAQDSIYGKTLKIRFTSKKSGKKIDLNVSFSHEHHKPPR